MMMRRQAAALLLLALCASAGAADDAGFCEGAAEAGAGAAGAWEMLPADLDDLLSSLPEDLVNATIQALDEGYVPGVTEAADALPPNQAWVYCEPSEREIAVAGCVQETADATTFQLRMDIVCQHTEHKDYATVTATVTVPADGGEYQVNVTDVSLDVDELHLTLPECTTAFCAACQPAEALEDESKETKDEVCTECQADHVLSDDGATCLHVNDTQGQDGAAPGPAAAAAEEAEDAAARTLLQFLPSDKMCGWGQYLLYGNPQDPCVACTRPGCSLGSGADCVHCFAWQGACVNEQWCRPPCAAGFFFRNQGCLSCNDFIPFCSACQPCAAGPACHGGAVCRACMPGYRFRGDGTGYCMLATA